MDTSKIKNSETGGLVVGVLLLFVALTFFCVPFVFSLDMMQWGYGLITFGLFFSIAAGVTLVMFGYRFFRESSILRGENQLVFWSYESVQLTRLAKQQWEKTKSENVLKLGTIWFFFILFTGLFVAFGIYDGEVDSMGLFVGMMLTLALIITAFAVTVPYFTYLSTLQAAPIAIIATNGLYFMGQLHTWNKPFAFIDQIKLDENKSLMVFSFKYFTKIGWYKYESYKVVVPIPRGEFSKAKMVVEKLT